MKKLFLIVAMLFSTLVSAGEFGSIDYVYKTYNSNYAAYETIGVLGTTNGPITLDAKGTYGTTLSGDGNSTLEGRVTYNFGLLYVRGGIGNTFVTNGGDYTFWTTAVGSKYNFTKQFAVFGEAEYNSALSTSKPQYETYKVGVSYDITPRNTVGTYWNVNSGDVNYHGIGANYTYKFN